MRPFAFFVPHLLLLTIVHLSPVTLVFLVILRHAVDFSAFEVNFLYLLPSWSFLHVTRLTCHSEPV